MDIDSSIAQKKYLCITDPHLLCIPESKVMSSDSALYVPFDTSTFEFAPFPNSILPISKQFYRSFSPEPVDSAYMSDDQRDDEAIVPIFETNEVPYDTKESIPKPKSPEKPIESLFWTKEEDTQLQDLTLQYSFHWVLISETINSNLFGHRTLKNDWSCYHRYLQLKFPEPTESNTQTSERSSKEATAEQILESFEFIRKCIKRRESQKSSRNFFCLALIFTLAPPSKKINLVAHETHQQSQIQAGININGPVLGPSELSVVKEGRDKEMRHTQVNNPMFSAYARNVSF
jgi:hypothetical protein